MSPSNSTYLNEIKIPNFDLSNFDFVNQTFWERVFSCVKHKTIWFGKCGRGWNLSWLLSTRSSQKIRHKKSTHFQISIYINFSKKIGKRMSKSEKLPANDYHFIHFIRPNFHLFR